MTLINKSTMKVRKRYRGSKTDIRALLIMNGLFLICFTIYQIILSKSNGGREAVASTYKSFLKGGSRDSANTNTNQDPIDENSEARIPQGQNGIPLNDPFSKENQVDVISNDFGEDENDMFGQGETVPNYVFDPSHQIFHNYHSGKSGKVVEEMMIAHAYVFHQNATYGGCCGSQATKMEAHEDLLDSLGLRNVLRFKCPRDFARDTHIKRSTIPRERFMGQDTHLWTPEYVNYLRSLVTYPERRHKGYTIVVHMLRGNTTPCKQENRGYQSYLPNSHYQKLINKYMRPGAKVIIYTSAKSFESLNEFRNRGYEVNTGTSLKEMWKDFVTADVFIMSRSDFSMVPAMVAKGTVVYTPFWHKTLRRWKRASKLIMKETDEETKRLQATHCEK